MSTRLICKNCGAECSETDVFCHSCTLPLNENNVSKDDGSLTINGIQKTEFNMMIEKNAARYLEIFKKNEEKTFFLHFNWAAALTSIYWFFYRGMYLLGILALIFLNIGGLVGESIVTVAQSNKYQTYQQELKAFEEQYGDFDEMTFSYQTAEDDPVYNQYLKLENTSRRLSRNIVGGMFLGGSIAQIIIGLTADWLYRRFLLKKGRYAKCGVSIMRILAALPIVYIANKILSKILLLILAGLLK